MHDRNHTILQNCWASKSIEGFSRSWISKLRHWRCFIYSFPLMRLDSWLNQRIVRMIFGNPRRTDDSHWAWSPHTPGVALRPYSRIGDFIQAQLICTRWVHGRIFLIHIVLGRKLPRSTRHGEQRFPRCLC
jgi:hypothetical protein